MVQRYNPDYVMHATRFAPFAREAEHGEFVKFSDYEALFSELASSRQINVQTLQVKLTMAETIKELTDRVNALAVERDALDRQLYVSAESFIDFDAGRWSPVNKPGRAAATLDRIASGRAQFGDRFLISYYGNTKIGRSLQRPIGTITTRDRWAVIDGERMRILTKEENMLAMSFPADYITPPSHKLTVHMAGNAVPPEAMYQMVKALKEQA
ncbi:DNA cytosine methyltransferase [Serratia marcescens]